MKWKRFRLFVDEDDPRPVKFPPPGPYWITGRGWDYQVVVAYFPARESHRVLEFWPEARVDFEQTRDEVTFTSRFPMPEWWSPPD